MKSIISTQLITTILLMPLLISSGAYADTGKSKDDLRVIFSKLEGQWSCKGETSKGKLTAANWNVSKDYDGQVLVQNHKGLKGNTNQFTSLWAYNEGLKNLTIVRQFVTANGVYSSVLLGDNWDENKVVFKESSIEGPLWRENRFTYEFTDPKTLNVKWETLQDDWQLGDKMVCTK